MKKQNPILRFLASEKAFYLISLLCLAWMMVVMVHYSGSSFWGDELGTLNVDRRENSFGDVLRIQLEHDPFVPPLVHLIMHAWILVAPYGTRWLLLICEAAVVIGIFAAGLTAKKVKGPIAGILTVMIGSIMSFLATQGGYELRQYALYFMFTALLLYSYFRKKEDAGLKNLLLYALFGLCSCYTHYCAVFFLFVLFLADVFQYFRKQITIRHLIPYIVWGLLYLPYLLYAYLHISSIRDQCWMPTPGITDFFGVLTTLLNTPWLLILYGCMVIWAILSIIRDPRKSFPQALLLWAILGFRLLDFIYSNINSKKSMWVPRYFFCLMPCFMLLGGLFLSEMLSSERPLIRNASAFLCTAFFVISEFCFIRNCKADRFPEVISQPFEQGAEYLRSMDDFSDPDTAIYYSADISIRAWQYYLLHGETPGNLNLLDKGLEGKDLSAYRSIYAMEIMSPIPESDWEILKAGRNCEELHHDLKIYRCSK